jgi:acyl dehydratase
MTTEAKGRAAMVASAGADLGASDWVEITQERVNLFADATDDHQWIHVDPERAADGPFGAPIAHGYLTLSLIVPMFSELLRFEGGSMVVNYGLNKVRFPTPVPVGSRIRLAARVATVSDVPGGAEVVSRAVIEVEGATKPACVAEVVFRYLD